MSVCGWGVICTGKTFILMIEILISSVLRQILSKEGG